jgi:EPS-associated MarR family transcriptional regulator
MTGKRDTLREDIRFRILRLLQEKPEMSQRELARAVGVSTGSVHYVLSALVEKGMLKLSNFTAAEDKRRFAYVLTPSGIAERARLTRRFMLRKLAEYEALKAEIDDISAEFSKQELEKMRTDFQVRDTAS